MSVLGVSAPPELGVTPDGPVGIFGPAGAAGTTAGCGFGFGLYRLSISSLTAL